MSDRVEFKPPKGFVPPEVQENGEFDLVCTFRTKPDGQICLTQLGDTKMPGYDSHEERGKGRPDYKEYASQMQGMVGQESNPGNPGGEGGGGY